MHFSNKTILQGLLVAGATLVAIAFVLMTPREAHAVPTAFTFLQLRDEDVADPIFIACKEAVIQRNSDYIVSHPDLKPPLTHTVGQTNGTTFDMSDEGFLNTMAHRCAHQVRKLYDLPLMAEPTLSK